jgi:MFS family permease
MNRTFWITLFIALANSISFTILIPILYLYGKQFGLNDFQTSLLFGIYSVAQFFATPVIGKLADRLGRKPLLIISLAGTVIANFMAGTATSAAILFFARFLDGITGGNVSVAQAIVADVIPPAQRAKAFGWFSAATFPHAYSYPLYASGILTFFVLIFAIAKRRQYSPAKLIRNS